MFKNKQSSKIGLKRSLGDKFYTDPKIAMECIQHFDKLIKPTKNDIILEPSAGSGSFSDLLHVQYEHVQAYDLEPTGLNIQPQDYLQLDTTTYLKDQMIVHVIGNPPFGRQSSLARKFIKKSGQFANTISFILPKSFKKESMRKTFPINYHLMFEIDLPENSFLVDQLPHDVPCVFQIWQLQALPRPIILNDPPNGYQYVKKDQDPDFSLRRVGVNAGKIDTKIEDKSFQSHYFLKLNDRELSKKETFIKDFEQTVKFNHENTVGPKSISKTEFTQQINKIMTKYLGQFRH